MAEEIVDLKAGSPIHYVRAAEPGCRPAKLLSNGICETSKVSGNLRQHAHLEYGSAESPQTHERTSHWDPLGAPDTWHLPDECPRKA